jgi:hypothetical protein
VIGRKYTRVLSALTVAVVLGLVAGISEHGVGAPPAEAQIGYGTYIARIPNTQVVVGIVMINGQTMVVYATDGATQADWFRASLTNVTTPTQDMTARSGTRLRMATATGAVPLGLIEIGGVVHEISPVPATGFAGVYRAQERSGDTTLLAGWIVTNDGEVRGALIQRTGDGPDVITPLDASTLDPVNLKGILPGIGAVEVSRLGAF